MKRKMEHRSPFIAILGATGKVGSQIVKVLSKEEISAKALSRKPPNFNTPANIQWVLGDMEKKADMEKFLEGTQKLFLNAGVSAQMVEQQCRVIDIAKQAGVKHIVKLSTPEARKQSQSPTGEWHWEIDEYLRNSGLSWNCLQPQSFMQNWLNTLAPSIRAERKIYSAAGNGKRAFTDTRDIAGVVVTLFMDAGSWIDATIPLSGSDLVTYGDIAKAFTQALNEPVTYMALSPEEAAQRMHRQGMPEYLINVTLVTEANQAMGLAERLISDNVEKITGKRPLSVYQFARDYAEYFR